MCTIELPSGAFLVSGWSHHSPDAGDSAPLLQWISASGEADRTLSPKMTRIQVDPAADGRIAFAGTFVGTEDIAEIGTLDEDGAVKSHVAAPGVSFAHLTAASSTRR